MVLTRAAAAAALLILIAASPPQQAQTGSALYGRVELRQGAAPLPRPDLPGAGTGPAGGSGPRRAVVYLESAPRAAFESATERRARMDQRQERFEPHVLAITAGTIVDFPNNDPTYHNVFSLSRTKTFDLGRYAAGRSKAVLFDRPGIVRVFCDIHSHMNAWILVFAHRFFSMTDAEGRYRIDAIPPGTYTVAAWHEAAPTESRPVTIPPGSPGVELNFQLTRQKASP
jgi:plastocyanin